MTLPKETIDRLLQLNPLERFQVEGREYFALSGKVSALEPPRQKRFSVATLTAVADYFRENPDQLDLAKVVVHIYDPQTVLLMSPVSGDWKDRDYYLAAETSPKSFQFGTYVDVESFIVSLQTYFVPSETTTALQKLVSSITDQESIAYEDDGIGQSVTAKTGIARVGTVPVPNPVTLAPYRTFREIVQPDSAFIFRLQKSGRGPQCALFEADGGNWQLEAVKRVRDYLRVNLPEGTIILA